MGACCDNSNPAPEISPSESSVPDSEPSVWQLGLSLLLTGNTMVVGLAISSAEAAANITLFIHIALLGSLVIVFELVGRPLAHSAWGALRRQQITFDLFFMIGIAAALGASLVSMFGPGGPVYFEVAAVLLVIHAVGRKVGAFRRRQGLAAARAWAPENKIVHRRTSDGALQKVALTDIVVGDLIVVGPGDMIGVDGVVELGTALVQEAEFTGEFFATTRRPGDTVFAGTHSLDGTLEIRTKAPAGTRLIDDVVRSVEEAWKRPSKWQDDADEAVQWFVPLVLIATVATFVGWTLAEDWTVGLINALAVLLVACPCALGFAVPLTVWATMGKWARRGLVPSHGQCVETLSRVDTVVFDKTGTLTEPAPLLIDFVVADGAAVDPGDLRHMIVEVERVIEHPVARALARLEGALPSPCCRSELEVDSVEVLPGRGITAKLRLAGISHILTITGFDPAELADLDSRDAAIITTLRERIHGANRARHIVVYVDDQPMALAAIDEKIRDTVDEGLALLRSMKIEIGLMTGDQEYRTRRLELDFVHAGMTPAQKHDAVKGLQNRGKTVLFVGDGVNDAAAMAESDVAIYVAGGSELAGEVGDLRWSGDDLRAIGRVIATARDAFTTVRFNLRFAAIYNAAGVAIAAAGLLHPVIAAVLMMTSSLFVTYKTTISVEAAAEKAWGSETGSSEANSNSGSSGLVTRNRYRPESEALYVGSPERR